MAVISYSCWSADNVHCHKILLENSTRHDTHSDQKPTTFPLLWSLLPIPFYFPLHVFVSTITRWRARATFTCMYFYVFVWGEVCGGNEGTTLCKHKYYISLCHPRLSSCFSASEAALHVATIHIRSVITPREVIANKDRLWRKYKATPVLYLGTQRADSFGFASLTSERDGSANPTPRNIAEWSKETRQKRRKRLGTLSHFINAMNTIKTSGGEIYHKNHYFFPRKMKKAITFR